MDHFSYIKRDFGNGAHGFALRWTQVSELETLAQKGSFQLLSTFAACGNPARDPEAASAFRQQDLREVIRLGLVGAGMNAVEAIKMVRDYVEGRPIEEVLPLGIEVLSAAMFGSPEYQEKQANGG